MDVGRKSYAPRRMASAHRWISFIGDRKIICATGHRLQTFQSRFRLDQALALMLNRTTSGGGVSGAVDRSSDKAREILTRRCSGIDLSTRWRTAISGLTINIPKGLMLSIGECLESARDISIS